MLLRGMHDGGCDDIYIIVTDLKRQEMDDVTGYFELATEYAISRTRRNSIEQQIQSECASSIPTPMFLPFITALVSSCELTDSVRQICA